MKMLNNTELENVSGGAYINDTSYYQVKQGDTLATIAARLHTSVKILTELNGINNPTQLTVGTKLQYISND